MNIIDIISVGVRVISLLDLSDLNLGTHKAALPIVVKRLLVKVFPRKGNVTMK